VSLLRGAIIGVGNIALKAHLPAFLGDETLRAEATIVAAADVAPQNLAAARKLLPSIRAYTSAEDLLAKETLDFVDICSPPNTHASIIEAAIEQNLHIVCEKPLATKLEDAIRIQERIGGKEIVFVPCHQYRYSAVWRSVKEILQRGELGDVLLAQFNVFRPSADSGNSSWYSNWRVDPRISGGGIIVDTGSHYLYLLSHLFGKPKQLTALTAKLRHQEYLVEDTALIVATYDRMIAEINLTWAAGHRENRNIVIGSEGSLSTGGDRIILNRNGAREERQLEDLSDKRTYVKWYAGLLKDFVRRVKTANFRDDLLREAIEVLTWTESCYESASKGIAVTLQ